MDLIKMLTGKNPDEYEAAAKSLVNNSDTELFSKLVKQDDFLFDFIKDNVAKRIQSACSKDNYLNLLNFLNYYSPYYGKMIAEVLYLYGGDGLFERMRDIFLNGNNSQKAYATGYFSLVNKDLLDGIIPFLRESAYSDFEPLAENSAGVLAGLNDEKSKTDALAKLHSEDEFVQFEGVKFLTAYGAKDTAGEIIEVMKKSSLSENIASEIPYLIPLEKLIEQNGEAGALVLANIVSAIPEIIPVPAVCGYDLYTVFEKILAMPLNSYNAVLLRLAKDKFGELARNDEYLFDCDRNTKEEVQTLGRLLESLNNHKLESFFYDELYEGSDFVFFALDYTNDIEALESLLDSKNQTLVLKVLTILKDRGMLSNRHKETALCGVTSADIRQIIDVL